MSAYSRSASLAAYQSVAAHGGVAVADPHQLIILLMDGALERIAAARGAMSNGEQANKARMIHRAVAILDELRASLNFEVGGQIAANLADVYDYASRQLMKANIDSKPELLDEVSHLLREIRGAWIAIPAAARTPPVTP
ncbi:MAG: flagellar export chaperone FliS [Pseudomonadota bacterium]